MVSDLKNLEDFLLGILNGGSFYGDPKCRASMKGIVYYGFEVIENREIYNPSKIMKAAIAAQKLTEY